jgi:hypothetical protein
MNDMNGGIFISESAGFYYTSVFEDSEYFESFVPVVTNSLESAEAHISKFISEKAVSIAQQRMFGQALSIKRGDSKLSDVPKKYRDEIKGMVDGMTEKELKKWASVKYDKLPYKVEDDIDEEFDQFMSFAESIESNNVNEAFDLIGKFGKAWNTIKEIAKAIGTGITEVLSFFKNKVIFGFFKYVGFSLQKMFEYLKQGYEAFVKLKDSLAKYIANTPLVKNVSEYAKWLDEFLDKYPILKKLSGVVIAYLLFYIWTNAISFTGDVEFDFNLQDMWDALMGKKGFLDIFGGENGAKMLTFIITNKAFGLTFPWPGATSVQFLFAIIYTIAKALGKRLTKAKNIDVEKIGESKKRLMKFNEWLR